MTMVEKHKVCPQDRKESTEIEITYKMEWQHKSAEKGESIC
jgi:hypothetical protein